MVLLSTELISDFFSKYYLLLRIIFIPLFWIILTWMMNYATKIVKFKKPSIKKAAFVSIFIILGGFVGQLVYYIGFLIAIIIHLISIKIIYKSNWKKTIKAYLLMVILTILFILALTFIIGFLAILIIAVIMKLI